MTVKFVFFLLAQYVLRGCVKRAFVGGESSWKYDFYSFKLVEQLVSSGTLISSLLTEVLWHLQQLAEPYNNTS